MRAHGLSSLALAVVGGCAGVGQREQAPHESLRHVAEQSLVRLLEQAEDVNDHEFTRNPQALGFLVVEALRPDVLLLAKGDHPILAALVGSEVANQRLEQTAEKLEILRRAGREGPARVVGREVRSVPGRSSGLGRGIGGGARRFRRGGYARFARLGRGSGGGGRRYAAVPKEGLNDRMIEIDFVADHGRHEVLRAALGDRWLRNASPTSELRLGDESEGHGPHFGRLTVWLTRG